MCIRDRLNRLGIEADLILFHPYDKGRWGFDGEIIQFSFKLPLHSLNF